MPVNKLKEFLNSHKIKYVVISHSPAFTAQQVAESAHISGKEMAKTVMVKLDGKLAMVVVPSNVKLDLNDIQTRAGSPKAELANEHEFADKFPGCELGAMPPFGNLYEMDVYLDKALSKGKQLAFNAGSHSELIQLACEDYLRLVNPKLL